MKYLFCSDVKIKNFDFIVFLVVLNTNVINVLGEIAFGDRSENVDWHDYFGIIWEIKRWKETDYDTQIDTQRRNHSWREAFEE